MIRLSRHSAVCLGVIVVLVGVLGCVSADEERLAAIEERLAEIASQQAELSEQIGSLEQSADDVNQSDRDDICDRSIVMQNRLLSHFNVSLCRAVTVGELYRIEGLSIQEGPHRLRATDFEGMINFRRLSLRTYDTDESSRSTGFDLPANFFRHLDSLTHLTLDGYVAESVLSHDFNAELPNLEVLGLLLNGWDNSHYTLEFTDFDVCIERRPEDPSPLQKQALYDLDTAFGRLAEC